MNEKIWRIVFILLAVLDTAWIFFNPYSEVDIVAKTPWILKDINNFFSSLGLRYRFVMSDVAAVTRFTEYVIFGIIMMLLLRVWSKSSAKNLCVPFFTGLAVAVGEIYYKFLNNVNTGVSQIIVSFAEFCIGMIFCIIFIRYGFPKKTGLKYRNRKYKGRC